MSFCALIKVLTKQIRVYVFIPSICFFMKCYYCYYIMAVIVVIVVVAFDVVVVVMKWCFFFSITVRIVDEVQRIIPSLRFLQYFSF